MRYKTEITVSGRQLDELLNPSIRSAAIENLLLTDGKEKVEEMLSPMNTDSRSSYLDGSAAVEEVSFDADGLTGGLSVSFQHEVYYGCKDMDRLDNDYAEITFEIDHEEKIVVFSIYQPDEREPDEF
ncbi:hypothetical protein P3T73_04160 [Kiritimatiellota bacterium B12222]|nr:hypothetical protein P3T73_04160 [Kiritimatiellota bacterium B12222]